MQLPFSHLFVGLVGATGGYLFCCSQQRGLPGLGNDGSILQRKDLSKILENKNLSWSQKLKGISDGLNPSDLKLPALKNLSNNQDGTQMNIDNPGTIPSLLPKIKKSGGFTFVTSGTSTTFVDLDRVEPLADNCLKEILRLTKKTYGVSGYETQAKLVSPKITRIDLAMAKLDSCQTWLKDLK